MDVCRPRRDLVDELFDEALEGVTKERVDAARVRVKLLLCQLQKAKASVAELERQLKDLRCELKETL